MDFETYFGRLIDALLARPIQNVMHVDASTISIVRPGFTVIVRHPLMFHANVWAYFRRVLAEMQRDTGAKFLICEGDLDMTVEPASTETRV